MPKALIITVGTGTEVYHGISFSIKTHNPNFIFFILTKQSYEKTFPKILESSEMKNKKEGEDWAKYILEDENDLEKIKNECEKLIENLIKQKKFSQDQIAIDYTSGTKSMSAALAIAGLYKNVAFLSYISGKRNENGIVISGTERKIEFSPLEIYCKNRLNEAVKYFNLFLFNPCILICEEVINTFKAEKINKPANILKRLAEAYNYWDCFKHRESFDILNNLNEDELIFFNLKSKILKNREFLHKIKENKHNPFLFERAVDLYENAIRKGDVHCKYDDAVARFYRLLEYLAQILLNEKGLLKKDEEKNWVLDLQKLPENLKLIYNEEKAGLMKCFNILEDLGNENIKLFCEDPKFKKTISIRNKSILAHGFDPVAKDSYEEIKLFIENLLKKIIPSFEELIKKAKYPKIDIEF